MSSLFEYEPLPAALSPGQRSRISIGLAQINNSFSDQCYLPYSVGLLQAHFSRLLPEAERFTFLPAVYSRIPASEAVDQLIAADVVFFSAYVWNIRLSLLIAERLKSRKPGIKIVFGGPQVPDSALEFLNANPCIDITVHGEGELVAAQLMNNCLNGEWVSTPGISYRDSSGLVKQNPRGPRISDLSLIPSPYLSGVFDTIMNAAPGQKWITLWETNRGCPFSCTFCDWGSATSTKVYPFDLERLHDEVKWFSERKIDFIFCCDANFGILKRDLEIARYVADIKLKTGFPQALSVQNTKNSTERTHLVQKVLADSGLNKGVTLSMQSLDMTTLSYVKRANISLKSYKELQQRFTRDRIETYGDLILALPGETYDSFVNGVSELMENGQHNRIQFNNLSILPNAPMAAPESMEKHGLIMVESDIINVHGSLADQETEVMERQQLVIGSNSMPKDQWVRTRAFCWLAALFHFDKILQIPIVLTRNLAGFTYREILEFFSEGDLAAFPVLSRVRDFFWGHAEAIAAGGPEYVHSGKYLNIYWPADEFILIRMMAEGEISAFYDEALRVLERHLRPDYDAVFPAIREAASMNRALLKTPFHDQDLDFPLQYNVWEYYQGILMAEAIPLQEISNVRTILRGAASWWNWDDYCREVIWYGNKKGAYLYQNRLVSPINVHLTG